MTTTTATTAAAPAAPAPPKTLTKLDRQRVTLRRLFDQQKPELVKLLPPNMSADRLLRLALTECVKNPKLLECTAESWALAVQECAAQGLYPDSGLGYMYLIPRQNSKKGCMEVDAQRGYQGDIRLARNTGEIDEIYAEVVHKKDHYKVIKGTDRKIIHEPYDGDDDPGPLRAVYAVAVLKSGRPTWVDLRPRDVARHKASAKDTDKSYSPWRTAEEAMWRKTAIHELFKWIPKSSEALEQVAARIAGEGQPAIETTAIDLGSVALPMEEASTGALDALTDKLAEKGAAAPAKDPTEETAAEAAARQGPFDGTAPLPARSEDGRCLHVLLPPSRLKPGVTMACPDCGEELRGEAVAQ